LDAIPAALTELDMNLDNTRQDLETVRTDLDALAADVVLIRTSIGDAQTVVAKFDAVLQELDAKVDNLRMRVKTWLASGTALGVVLLVWLAITQVGLFFQGWEMASRFYMRTSPPKTKPEA
jgi:hypothetical protein